jgi:hypothetical protein
VETDAGRRRLGNRYAIPTVSPALLLHLLIRSIPKKPRRTGIRGGSVLVTEGGQKLVTLDKWTMFCAPNEARSIRATLCVLGDRTEGKDSDVSD